MAIGPTCLETRPDTVGLPPAATKIGYTTIAVVAFVPIMQAVVDLVATDPEQPDRSSFHQVLVETSTEKPMPSFAP